MAEVTTADSTAAGEPGAGRSGGFDLDFPRAHGALPGTAGFRRSSAHFRVDEELGFAPDGDGEHLYLQVRKTDQNTRWVARLLAEHFAVDAAVVGYSGLKDRHAITVQWFSVQLPGGSAVPELPALEGCEILAAGRHPRKLRPGSHRRNHFVIRLSDFEGDRAALVERLACIARHGVPNYFGEQRFGIGGGNLREVERILAARSPRFKGNKGGLYLSAARSWLFNQVLAARVLDGSWLEEDAEGPLWGRGRPRVAEDVAGYEAAVLAAWQPWCDALEHSGLRQERRPLALSVEDLCWHWEDDDLVLGFSLPPGCYATALLRETAVLTLSEAMV
ncbi:MAG: tRNA pseudouridine(13) synthase TruD [Porticoccaceae bacterium]